MASCKKVLPCMAVCICLPLLSGSAVTLRENPNTQAKVIDQIANEENFGWVLSQYLSQRNMTVSRGDSIGRDREDSTKAEKLVSCAKKLLGTRYDFGGDSPREGFDCSGFTKYVFSLENIELERTAAGQAAQGIKVKKESLRAGDLVFFDTNGGHNQINHVGIYIGEGSFIHASSPKHDVITNKLAEKYYKRTYMTARRILK